MQPKTIKIQCELCREEWDIVVLDVDYYEWLDKNCDSLLVMTYINDNERGLFNEKICERCRNL